MIFVVITKTVSDLKSPTKIQKHLPAYYPVECKEYPTYEAAILDYPTCVVMPAEGYKDYHKSLEEIYNTAKIEAEKPWFKFW